MIQEVREEEGTGCPWRHPDRGGGAGHVWFVERVSEPLELQHGGRVEAAVVESTVRHACSKEVSEARRRRGVTCINQYVPSGGGQFSCPP